MPHPILISLGFINIYWYGLTMVTAMAAGLFVSLRLAKKQGIDQEKILDLAVWLILAGLIGARIYEIFLEFPYYSQHPEAMVKIWQGGLAIHGAIIGGLLALFIFSKLKKINFWILGALVAPALALGQAIGRWGNWFNQELFGRPTSLPWGIPISPFNRPQGYINFEFFQPTFLYESLGCILIFIVLVYLFKRFKKLNQNKSFIILGVYAIGYGLLRGGLEFIKIDPTPTFGVWRLPQIASLVLIILGIIALIKSLKRKSV